MPLSHWARMRSHATVGRGERWPASVGMRRRAWLSIAAGPEPRLGDLDQPPGRQPPPSTGRQGRQTGPAAQCRLDEHLGRYEHGNPVSVGKRRISRVPTASSAPWGGVPAGSAGRGRRSSPRRVERPRSRQVYSCAPGSRERCSRRRCGGAASAGSCAALGTAGRAGTGAGTWRAGRPGRTLAAQDHQSGPSRHHPIPERAAGGHSRHAVAGSTSTQCEKRELHASNTSGTRAT